MESAATWAKPLPCNDQAMAPCSSAMVQVLWFSASGGCSAPPFLSGLVCAVDQVNGRTSQLVISRERAEEGLPTSTQWGVGSSFTMESAADGGKVASEPLRGREALGQPRCPPIPLCVWMG